MTAGTRRTWTPQEDATMLDWREDGMLLNEIAARLGSNRTSISSRITLLKQRAAAAAGLPPPLPSRSRSELPAPTHPSKPGGRKCLGCGCLFASAHAGNRLCYRCKQVAERVSAG